MWEPDDVVATARAVRAQLGHLLPPVEARTVDAELGMLLSRADAGEDVTDDLLEALRGHEATREAAFALLRGERVAGGYAPLLGVTFRTGGRYVCPVSGCRETGDRLDDSEPEPRCPIHDVNMQRL
jgi:hypothetical protein